MPTYSYKCKDCEEVFDAFHSMSCTDSQHCPTCKGVGKKLMSASSVIFKGSGFYSTDYRDSGYLEAKKKDGETKPGPKPDTKSDSPSTAGDSKPESKSSKDSNSSSSTEKSSSPTKPVSPVAAAA